MDIEYNAWLADPTPNNLNKVVQAANPMITSEVYRYSGAKEHLRSKAKVLTANAIKTYDPTRGAALKSWVVSQLKPLYRYSHQLKPIAMSEVMARQAAELNNKEKELLEQLGHKPSDPELADFIGINPLKIAKIRKYAVTPVSSGQIEMQTTEDSSNVFDPGVEQVNPYDFASEAVYDSLDVRDKMIYDLKTGAHGKRAITNQEIAKRMGVSPALITQISDDISNRIQRTANYGI